MDALVQGAVFLAIAGLWSVFVAKVLGPWAWARAVDNPKSKASRVLTRVLKETREAIVAGVKIPSATELAAAMPKPDLSGLNLQIDLEPVRAIIREEIATFEGRQRAAHARGESPQVAADEAARIQQAAANPEGAELLSRALKALDRMVDLGVIKSPTAKKYAKELRDEFGQSGDITNLVKSFGIDPAALGAPGVTLVGRASTGGHY